eukprot:8483094-Karenia_brevis.AAC.1
MDQEDVAAFFTSKYGQVFALADTRDDVVVDYALLNQIITYEVVQTFLADVEKQLATQTVQLQQHVYLFQADTRNP